MRALSLRESLRLVLVTPDHPNISSAALLQSAHASLKAGVTSVMFREKSLDDRNFVEQALALKSIAHNCGAGFILNERVHLVDCVEPDMVHLTWKSVPVAKAVNSSQSSLFTGRSIHSLQEAHDLDASLDYVVFGPIFPTPSKKGLVPVQGLDALDSVCKALSLPVVAIGGVTPSRACECVERGAAGVAVLSGFEDYTVSEYLSALDAGEMPDGN